MTFATYGHTGGSQTISTALTNNAGGGSATLSSTVAGGGSNVTLVSFDFLLDDLPTELDTQAATMVLSASAIGQAGCMSFLGNPCFSVGRAFNGIMTYTRSTPYPGKTNLLTVEFKGALLGGQNNFTSGGFQAATSTGLMVNLTSEFVNFSGALNRDFSIALTSIIQSLAIDADGDLRSFTAFASGNFSSDPAPALGPGARRDRAARSLRARHRRKAA